MIRLTVHAKPGSPKEGFEQRPDGTLVGRVRSLAVDNKANQRLVELIARVLKIPKRNIELLQGHTHRIKVFDLDTILSKEEVLESLIEFESRK